MDEHIISLEKSLLDRETLQSIERMSQRLADDFVEIEASGFRLGKQDVLNWVSEQPVEMDFHMVDPHTQRLSSDTVLLTYRAKLRGKSKEFRYSYRSSVWRKSEHAWQLVFHQGTPCEAF